MVNSNLFLTVELIASLSRVKHCASHKPNQIKLCYVYPVLRYSFHVNIYFVTSFFLSLPLFSSLFPYIPRLSACFFCGLPHGPIVLKIKDEQIQSK